MKLRKEIKYPITFLEFSRLRKRLECYMQPDPYSGSSGYRVRTLYFEACDDRDLLDCLNGSLEKRKIRLRFYPPDTEFFRLEYKCKYGLEGIKHSITLSKEQACCMIRGDYSFLTTLADPLATELYGRLMTGVYRPKVIVDYHRIAYIYPADNTRINFDTAISGSYVTDSVLEEHPGLIPVMNPDSGVLEVKYDNFLVGVLKEILESVNLLSSAYSKYMLSRFIL